MVLVAARERERKPLLRRGRKTDSLTEAEAAIAAESNRRRRRKIYMKLPEAKQKQREIAWLR